MGTLIYSLHVSNIFSWRDGFNVNRGHIFLHGVLAAITLTVLEAREGGARARVRFEMSLTLCFVAIITLSAQFSFSSVSQSCPTLCDPMNHSMPGLPTITNFRASLRLTSIESVMPSRHLILCHPLLLLPPIPPSIRVFSNESNLRMRWLKYWSFGFSIIPSKEIPQLISF